MNISISRYAFVDTIPSRPLSCKSHSQNKDSLGLGSISNGSILVGSLLWQQQQHQQEGGNMPRPSSFPLFLFVASLVLCYGQGTSEPSDEITTRRPSNLVTNVFVRGASSHNPATDEIADNSISSEQNYTNEKEISTVGDDEKISHGSVVETQRYLNGERKRDNRHRRLLLGEQTSRGRRKKSAFNEIFQQFKGIEEAYSRGQVDHPVKENRPCDDDLEQIFNSLEMSMPKTKNPIDAPTILPPVSPPMALPASTIHPDLPVSGPSAKPLSTTSTPSTLFPVSANPSNAPSESLIKVPATTQPTRYQYPSIKPSRSPSRKPTYRPSETMVCNPSITLLERQSTILDIIKDISPIYTVLSKGTSQNLAYNWLVNDDSAFVCPEKALDVIQRFVLATNYFSMGGDSWTICSAASVNGTSPCAQGKRHLGKSNVCDWFNVTCGSNNSMVTSVTLDNNGLVGSLASELSALGMLKNIGFNNNEGITGSIPAAFGSMSSLQTLDLNSSSLSGDLPKALCSATKLQRLDVLSNFLGGSIPSCVGRLLSLDTLALDRNFITGTLPASFGLLSSLEYLTVNENELTGLIPMEIGDISSLKVLSVQENNFNGTLPTSLGGLTEIKTLNFFSNQISGLIPSEFGKLTKMENLFLHFNALTGTMPDSICALRQDRGGVGLLKQLTADCGLRGAIVCPRDCCTACF